VNNELGQQVPFYFLPYVGGVDTVRGFKEFRFKDENAMWLSAEYKYVVIKYLSLAAFVDAGKVAHNWEDIDFSDLKKGYGLGLRVHSRKATFVRLDFGTGGGEGWHTFLKLGAGF
jgi:outer membrane protein assembly factor BamA